MRARFLAQEKRRRVTEGKVVQAGHGAVVADARVPDVVECGHQALRRALTQPSLVPHRVEHRSVHAVSASGKPAGLVGEIAREQVTVRVHRCSSCAQRSVRHEASFVYERGNAAAEVDHHGQVLSSGFLGGAVSCDGHGRLGERLVEPCFAGAVCLREVHQVLEFVGDHRRDEALVELAHALQRLSVQHVEVQHVHSVGVGGLFDQVCSRQLLGCVQVDRGEIAVQHLRLRRESVEDERGFPVAVQIDANRRPEGVRYFSKNGVDLASQPLHQICGEHVGLRVLDPQGEQLSDSHCRGRESFRTACGAKRLRIAYLVIGFLGSRDARFVSGDLLLQRGHRLGIAWRKRVRAAKGRFPGCALVGRFAFISGRKGLVGTRVAGREQRIVFLGAADGRHVPHDDDFVRLRLRMRGLRREGEIACSERESDCDCDDAVRA